MKRLSGVCGFRAILFIAILLTASSAFATTVRIPRDEELALGARAIVRGKILAVECAMDNQRIYTYITLRIQEVLKGQFTTRKIVIKEEGGQYGSLGSVTWGTPQFTPDEQVLVYLTTRSDGSLRVYDMFLGKYNIIADEATNKLFVSRAAPDENVVVLNSQTAPGEITERMELAQYTAMVREKVELTSERFAQFEETYFRNQPIVTEPAEYARQKSRGGIQPQFRFLRASQPSRWFEPDSNQAISFTVNLDGAPNPQVVDDIVASMNAWSSISGSAIRVTYAGTTSDCYPHGTGNTMVFNNCDNAFAQTPDCATIIALGSINWDTSRTRLVNGVTFAQIYQGHISFNPYSACSYDNHCNIQEIATHELGHTLGLGHSQDPAATMAGTAHFDGRCATVKDDDKAGMRFIYPADGTVGSQLRIFTEALPDAYIGTTYEYTLMAGGGVPNFNWSLVAGSGSLPGGFVLLPSGLIRGTPLASGSFTFTVRVIDATQATAEKSFTLVIAAEQSAYNAQFVSQNVATTVQAGQTFSANLKWNNTGTEAWDGFNGCRLAAMNPAGNTTWGGDSISLIGFRVEAGRQLDITFTARAPQQGGTYNFQWQLYQEGVGAFGQLSTNLQITVIGASNPPSITSLSSYDATVGASFNQQLAATGGQTPYTWSIVSGSLPAGLSLNTTTGLIAGTPSAIGGATFTAQVTDAASRTAQKQITINVRAVGLDITTASFPTATTGVSFNAPLTATGGAAPYSWGIASGSVPTGITLNPTTGMLSGTPTSVGNFLFVVQVRDSQSLTAQKSLSITVNPPPLELTTTTLPTNTLVRANYNTQFAATGGQAPYTWAIVAGALPEGLTLNAATGALTGAATATGTFNFTIEVRDTGSRTARKDFVINIVNVPLALEKTSASFEVMKGVAFSYLVKVTGGVAPYTWNFTQGGLPVGLSLNANTGLITGTPTSVGTFDMVISVRDQKPEIITTSLRIQVIDPNSIALITRTKYKPAKRMLQIFGERFDAAAIVLVDGAQVNAKLNDGIFVLKRYPLAAGNHQVVIINPDSIASQAFVFRIE
ncbi:MAG: putative Ig domain-containing protein [Acidobacteriota bacterium]